MVNNSLQSMIRAEGAKVEESDCAVGGSDDACSYGI
jgi:hypothetical protein